MNTDIATMNDIVREEIRKHQSKRRAETERARMVEASRGRLLARRLTALNKVLNRKPRLLKRLCAPVTNTWALCWAMSRYAPEILLNWCEAMGWIERVDAA